MNKLKCRANVLLYNNVTYITSDCPGLSHTHTNMLFTSVIYMNSSVKELKLERIFVIYLNKDEMADSDRQCVL